MNTTKVKTAAINGIKRVTEKALMGSAATSYAMQRVLTSIEETSFNQAVKLRASRKDISREESSVELGQLYTHTLENIDLKYAKLQAIFSPKKKEEVKDEGVKNWEPKIV